MELEIILILLTLRQGNIEVIWIQAKATSDLMRYNWGIFDISKCRSAFILKEKIVTFFSKQQFNEEQVKFIIFSDYSSKYVRWYILTIYCNYCDVQLWCA